METNITKELSISNDTEMIYGKQSEGEIFEEVYDKLGISKHNNILLNRTWNWDDMNIMSSSGELLLKLYNITAVLLQGTGCTNTATISFDVETHGWRSNGTFPIMLQLKSGSGFPLWQVDRELDIKCGINFPYVSQEVIKVNIFDFAFGAKFNYPNGAEFYKCP
ncbi:hypothetical protein U9K47_15675 [Bacillus toyonensis]|uniref:hypothetical protein n=1 Tax=Bacillus toyonensis TaxID=155322 RepID=UPI003466ACD7